MREGRTGRQDCLPTTLTRFFEGQEMREKGDVLQKVPLPPQKTLSRRIPSAAGKGESRTGCRMTAFFLCAAGGLMREGRTGRQDCLPTTLTRFFEG